jgi:hypothetical protein
MGLLKNVVLALALGSAAADVPSHCLRSEYVGEWTLSLGQNDNTFKEISDYNCAAPAGGGWVHEDMTVTLSAEGNEVTYDQGEVVGTWCVG